MTTRRIFPFPHDLDIIDEWLMTYDAKWQRCTSVEDVFDISSLPSNGVIGHDVVVRASHLDCHGLSWDTGAAYGAGSNVLRRDFPILPVVWTDPQLFTELLPKMNTNSLTNHKSPLANHKKYSARVRIC
jgi:hypothetical protein